MNFFNRVTGEQNDDVEKIIQIVIGTPRPLSVQEMAIPLGIATSTQSKTTRDTSQLSMAGTQGPPAESREGEIRDLVGRWSGYDH